MNQELNLPQFIVFEGIDGSGKTTLSKMLLDHLKKRGIDVQWFREPSDSQWGKKIRDLARLKESIPMKEELHYFVKDRKWDVKHNIAPALARGQIVILDRYYFSTACYQGARGLNMKKIIKQNLGFAPEPDLTFIIDVEVSTALRRITSNRQATVKLFERKEFLIKVRENYITLAADHIVIIDGNHSLQHVFNDILKHLGH